MSRIDKNKTIEDAICTANQLFEAVKAVKEGRKDNSFYNFEAFRASNLKADNLFEKLIDEKKYSVDDSNKENDVAKLMATLETFEKKAPRKSLIGRFKKITAVACAAAAVAVVSFFVLGNRNKSVEVVVDKIPIVTLNAPLLILENGENLALNRDEVLDVKKIQNKIAEKQNTMESNEEEGPITYNRVIIPAKNTLTIMLSDGTRVTLNADSELLYPSRFNGDTRSVHLVGEAYFDVAKGDIPFIVSTDGMDVKVYGTTFNVNTRRGDIAETVLISGSIGITTTNNEEVMLKPDQRYSYNNKDGQFTVEDVDTYIYVAWMGDCLSCHNEPITVLLDEMAAWYDVEFSIGNDIDKDMKVTVSLSKKLTLEQFTEILNSSLGVTFERTSKNTYNVYNKKKGVKE